MMAFTKLQAGSYESKCGKFAITASATTRGYWDFYRLTSAGDLEWLGVEWGLANAKQTILDYYFTGDQNGL